MAIKLKHFYHIEGSTEVMKSTHEFLTEVEKFINDEQINPVEISHSFTPSAPRTLSVFISYVEMDQQVKDAIAHGVALAEEQTKKEAEAVKAPTSQGHKGNSKLASKKPSDNKLGNGKDTSTD